MITYPLVSCLCVTRNRPIQLSRAIKCFKAQTHPNKELIVVTEDNNTETIALVNAFKDDQIKLVVVDSLQGLPLGQLRNIAIEHASGEYFCQWDDDDWYHNDRIKAQLSSMADLGKPSSVMITWIMFDATTGDAYLSAPAAWQGSIMCKKDTIKGIQYPPLPKGEDTVFVLQLFARNFMAPILKPTLYIYVFHGANTWDNNHFNAMFNQAQKLSKEFSSTIQRIMNGEFTNDEASRVLNSEELLRELNHFHWITGGAKPAAIPPQLAEAAMKAMAAAKL